MNMNEKKKPNWGARDTEAEKEAAFLLRLLWHCHMVCPHYSVILLVLPYTATAPFCSDIFVISSNMLPLTPFNLFTAWKRQFIQTHLLQQSLPWLTTPWPEHSCSPWRLSSYTDGLLPCYLALLHVLASCVKCFQLPSSSSQKQQNNLKVMGYFFPPLNLPLCLTPCWIYKKHSRKVKWMLNESRLKQNNSQIVKFSLWTSISRIWTSFVISASDYKGSEYKWVGEYLFGH